MLANTTGTSNQDEKNTSGNNRISVPSISLPKGGGGFVYDDGKALSFVLKKEDGTELSSQFKVGSSPITSLPYAEPLQSQRGKLGKWSLEVKEDDVKTINASLQQKVKINGQDQVRLHPDAIEDVWIVCEYQVLK